MLISALIASQQHNSNVVVVEDFGRQMGFTEKWSPTIH